MDDKLFKFLTNVDGDILCPKCGSAMALRQTNKFLYGNGQPRKFFSCTQWPRCNGSHSAHPDGRPVGKPADEPTKEARRKAHDALREYQAALGLSRNGAYRHLCKLMKLRRADGHIGMFDLRTCQRLIDRLSSRLVELGLKQEPAGT